METTTTRSSAGDSRSRSTSFILSRYHDAFAKQIDALRANIGDHRLMLEAIETFATRLRRHDSLHRNRLFPALEDGKAYPKRLHDLWALDALRMFLEIDRMRDACDALARDHVDGVARLLNDVQDHLAVEASLFAEWTRKAN